MTTQHTFRDGITRPAHQHPNGGGWVADTASVSDAAYIGPEAEVIGGTIEGGTIWGGTIDGGTILGGTIWGGTIEGGTIEGGTIEGGTIWGGTIDGGTILGGTIWGGTIEGGTIRDGTIWGGTVTRSPVFVAGFAHPVTITDSHMGIGCQWLTHDEWRERGAAIAAEEKQPAEMLALALALMEAHAKGAAK